LLTAVVFGLMLVHPLLILLRLLKMKEQFSITGEAYFEVAADKTKPFRVTNGHMQVEGIGNAF
jgi:hypothetical protein